jgi:putative multiple sugar transport system permease protein
MLLCILTGGNIDLAVGSVVCFTGGIGAVMMSKNLPMILAVLVMLCVGLLIGMFQGFWIAWVSVPPFIATLAGMYAFRGLSNVVLNGFAVGINNTTFLNVFGGGADCYIPDFLHGANLNMTCLVVGIAGAAIFAILSIRGIITRKQKGIGSANSGAEIAKVVVICALVVWISWKLANYKGIPTVLIWIALVLLVYGYITTNTAIGRYFYAVGGNEKATRLSGVNTKLVYFVAYANMGMLAGLAGILTVARASSAQPTYGQGYEMDAIASCFIGGASAYGGVGKITGVIIGATLMGIINQGMSIMSFSANYQRAVKGVVLLAAVLIDVLSKKEKA